MNRTGSAKAAGRGLDLAGPSCSSRTNRATDSANAAARPRITATSAITMPVTASHCGARQRAKKHPGHRMHTDDEDDREQDGSEDRKRTAAAPAH